MRNKLRTLLLLLGVLAMTAACEAAPGAGSAAPAPSPGSPDALGTPAVGGALVIGTTAVDPAKTVQVFQPLADYLAGKLTAYGIGTGEVKVTPDPETIAGLMKTGKVDLFIASPWPALIASDTSGGQPILRRWKGGIADYYTMFITRSTSGITDLAALRGQMVGFEDPYSTSGYFLPRVYLTQAGLHPVEKPSADAPVAPNEVGYVFSQDNDNTVQWVLDGKVPAGAIDNQVYAAIPDASRAQLRVLARTEAVPRHLVLARPGLNPDLLAALEHELKNMDQTAEGQAVLRSFEKTTKFDDFPAGTAWAQMRTWYTVMQSH